MGCAAGNDCCSDCASADAAGVEARSEILAKTKALIDAAEYAVSEGGQCGSYGVFESAAIFLSGEADSMVSGAELCRRQEAALGNLRLMYGQLEEMLASPTPSRDRLVQLLDAIETTATGLVDEAALSSWAEFTRAYARNVGQVIGDAGRTALDAAVEGVKGVARGLGGGWLVLGAVALYVYFNPRVLRGK